MTTEQDSPIPPVEVVPYDQEPFRNDVQTLYRMDPSLLTDDTGLQDRYRETQASYLEVVDSRFGSGYLRYRRMPPASKRAVREEMHRLQHQLDDMITEARMIEEERRHICYFPHNECVSMWEGNQAYLRRQQTSNLEPQV